MDAFSELKGLADTADGIINKTKNYDRRLEEWFSLFKQAAVDIVSGYAFIFFSPTFLEKSSLLNLIKFIVLFFDNEIVSLIKNLIFIYVNFKLV